MMNKCPCGGMLEKADAQGQAKDKFECVKCHKGFWYDIKDAKMYAAWKVE